MIEVDLASFVLGMISIILILIVGYFGYFCLKNAWDFAVTMKAGQLHDQYLKEHALDMKDGRDRR